MEVIPSIDLRGGCVVRLEQGDYERETIYERDPRGVAERLTRPGPPRLHVVDLDGARDGEPGNLDAIRQILDAARGAQVPVQVGGGVRSLGRAEQLLGLGADRVVIGTAALEQPELVSDVAGLHPGRVVLGLDARAGQVAVRGWKETSSERVSDVLARFEALPLAGVLHTDIGRDGLLGGPAVEATAELARSTKLPVIASGGVSSLEDLQRLAETRVIAGAIVGRALYTGALSLEEALRAEISRC